MKRKINNLIVLLALAIIAPNANAQYDNNRNQQDNSYYAEQNIVQGKFYIWNAPEFYPIDMEYYKNNSNSLEDYYEELKNLEDITDKNRDILETYEDEVSDLKKIWKNEWKFFKDKRRYIKQITKFLKDEKKMYDKELKAIDKKRNVLIKDAEKLSPSQVQKEMKYLADREYRVKIALQNWETKKIQNEEEQRVLLEEERALKDREKELEDREKELERYEDELKLQEKQLSAETKYTRSEIKRIKKENK